ncbi:hypothetical protein SADUNF_Sadunf16G0087600 [Salix dunnii]|uniref:Chromo domain-containing protein n=1 Tax=Salix dunnii TaxID=1413687 RepID=A0A835MGE7_9ROSI|nr:hypothetical protein SADUNF_Sadunf16G0087600 [Salix dunnii]
MFVANVPGFESMKADYVNDEDFSSICRNISDQGHTDEKEYALREGFLFYKSRLYVPHEFKGDVDNISTQLVQAASPAPRIPETTASRDEITAILDHQFITTRRGGYYKFLVQWKNHPHSDSVWLQASEIKRLHPQLFTEYTSRYLPESSSLGGLAIDANQERNAE